MRIITPILALIIMATTACGGGNNSTPSPSVELEATPTPSPIPSTPEPSTPTSTPTPTPPTPVAVPEPMDPSAFQRPTLTPSVCDTGLSSDAPSSVELTFSVEVPSTTPENAQIYFSGDIEGWSGGSNPAFEAIRQPEGRYELTIDLASCRTIVFKFTRGTWGDVERDPTGNERPNRTFRIDAENTEVPIKVESWADLSTPTRTNFWNTPIPSFTSAAESPEISLIGEPVAFVLMGEDYNEEGAIAFDPQEGEITDNLVISGNVDTSTLGDYWITYSVRDADNNSAVEKSRIVRVYSDKLSNFSLRGVGDTPSHLGYMEHLPTNYGEPGMRYPLIISHHGGRADANTVSNTFGGTPLSSVSVMLQAGGIGNAIHQNLWPHDSPAIVLVPQRSELAPPNMPRIDAFVEFAKAHYAVDESRIYMEGWSQGGFITALYGSDYPNVLAAGVSIAGGFFFQPQNPCGMSETPLWALHGDADTVVGVSQSRNMVNQINACSGSPNPARLTVFPGQAHNIYLNLYDERLMGRESSTYQAFDESIHDWLLRQSLPSAQ